MKSSMISNCIATLVMGITYQDVHDDALENYSFPPSHSLLPVAVHCGVVFNASSGAITESAEPAGNSFWYW